MKPKAIIPLSLFFSIGLPTIYAQSKTSKGTQSDITISRNVSATQYNPSGEAVVIVTITINKNTSRGKAMLEEDFSSDLEATVIKGDGAVFQTKNGEADFEWVNIPLDKDVTISYQLKAVKKTTDDQAVFGKFSYQNHTYAISPSSFSLKIVSGATKPRPMSKDSVISANTIPSHTASPSKPGELIYRIQLAAVPDKLKAQELLKEYKITDEPYLETVNASTMRLMIGSYSNFSSAKAKIDELRSKGVTGAFVVPYYKGKRTNLQDAAMHTQQ